MADTAASPAPAPAPAPKKAKKGGAKKTPSHPKYSAMIAAAITELKERGGSSRQAILKHIIANHHKIDEKSAATQLKLALKRGVAAGTLKQVKGAGASGSFRISKSDEPKVVIKKTAAVKKPAAKKATPKKPAAKKSPKKPAAKKAAKKPAAKKSPKKPAAKKAAKKPAAKKAVKKPAAKKAAKKPAAKKAAKK